MTVSIKTTALVLALTAMAGAGSAAAQTATQNLNQGQTRSLAPSSGAAATLPNTFDNPATPATPATPPAAPRPQVSNAEMAESALRAVIEQLQAGDIQEAMFTPDLSQRINSQMSTFSTLIQGFGDLQTIEPSGVNDGVAQYLVTFDNAATQWLIGLEDGGLIAALLFRPAPPESSEPTPPGA
jgi:hypothetical protein